MKDDKKYIYVVAVLLLVVVALGISYAWFSAIITGNDTAKNNKVVTGDLELTYTDTNEISLDNVIPGDSFTKEVSVKNTGTLDVKYNLVWQSLTNTITNNELVIEATCKRLNSSGAVDGTCEAISQKAVSSNKIKLNIAIEPGITHVYTVKVTFIDTGEPQNYNKNKSFNGKLGIEEFELPSSVSFAEDSWETIVTRVQAGEISTYNVGDTKEVNLGTTYGTHTLRIANTSTPDECKTEGFSQSACGFVLEFADIITTHNMNPAGEYNGTDYAFGWNKDGWPASSMYTFVNTDIYNALSSELRNVIIDTATVSGHGSEDTDNFTSTDKLYLLSTAEVWTQGSSNTISTDSARDVTRQLDYYSNLGISTSNYSGAVKNNGTSAAIWALRTASSSNRLDFFCVTSTGAKNADAAEIVFGVSPAFRLG
jgi:hypothetical protein